jgi:HTH-type transcriptional regulator/antitoxin HigA
MSDENEPLNYSEWEDFHVTNEYSCSTATDIYKSYKIYKEHFFSIPKSELVKRGWISSVDDIFSLSSFFRDIHLNNTSTLYRKSDSASKSITSLWLSKLKSQAEVNLFMNSISDFNTLSKENLREIAQLSTNVKVLTELPYILAGYGINLVYLKSLPSMKLDGVVFKMASGNPVIGMSLRYSRLDYFWFTLLHELAHIVLHLDVLDNPILDDLDCSSDSEIEISADRLAKKSFVDRSLWRSCEPKYNKSAEAIDRFSSKVGVHRSIVAGMLRREFGDYASFSNIVNEYDVREIIFNGD